MSAGAVSSHRHRAVRPLVALFLLGTIAGLAVQSYEASQRGGWTALLNVGTDDPARHSIQRELGEVADTGWNHDGRFSYMIARDPVPSSPTQYSHVLADAPPSDDARYRFDWASYRYRRVLYSWVSGLGGLASPRLTLGGLVAWSAIGAGLTAAGLWALAGDLRARRWPTLIAFASGGMFYSLVTLTSDALAMGLGVVGILLAVRGRTRSAVLVLVAAALAKEVYLLVGVGLALYFGWQRQWRTALAFAIVPASVVGAWAVFVSRQMAEPLSGDGMVVPPFAGFLEAAPWGSPVDAATSVVAMLLAVAVPVACWRLRQELLLSLTLPWSLLAICSGASMWRGDALRLNMMIVSMGFLALGVWLQRLDAGTSHTTIDAGATPSHADVALTS